MASRLRVYLIGVATSDLEALRVRSSGNSALEIVGSALKADVEHGRVRLPANLDAVLMSPGALAARGDIERADVDLVEAVTPRELDVLALVADGYGNRAIAARLGISEHTVKFHLSSIFGKLGASTRTEAVRRGLELGLIEI